MEEIRGIQQLLNDVRHNLATLINSGLTDAEVKALEHSNALLNVADRKLNAIKSYLASSQN